MKTKLVIAVAICAVIGATAMVIHHICTAIDDISDASISVHEIMTPAHLAAHKMFLNGRVQASHGKYQEAIQTFTRSHEMVNQDIINARHELAGQPVEMPLIAAQFEALGFCFYKLGKYADAEKELGWAIDCKRNYAPFYQARALINDRQNRSQLAAADRQTAAELKSNPRTVEPRNFEPMFIDELKTRR